MKVLLLHLPLTRRSYISRFSMPEPLAHMYIAPVLAPRHELKLVDLRLTPRLDRALGDFEPDVALVGIGPLTIGAAEPVLAQLRTCFPHIKIALVADAEYGNAHVHDRPLDFVHPLADALVQPFVLTRLREIVPHLLDAWERGRSIANVAGVWIQEKPNAWRATETVPNRVGDIGVPDRELLGALRGSYRFVGIGRMAHLFYTYGCRFKCRFCPMSKHDGSIVARPVADVIAELEAMTEPHVFLEDYEPFLAPEAMDELADAVERAGIRKQWYMLTRADTALAQRDRIARWKELGLRWLYIGLDGESPQRLKEIRKANTVETNEEALRAMRALGLCVTTAFVVRSDYTHDDFAALRAYVRKLRAPLVGFTVETPLVGTRLFDDEERRLTTHDWSLFDLSHAVLPTSMPLDEFYAEMASLHLAAGLRTLPTMLRHFPLRDVVRALTTGWGGLLDVKRAAADHEDDPMSPQSNRPALSVPA